MGLAGGNGASGDKAQAEMAGHMQVTWRKSSWSTYNGNCVEVAQFADGQVGVRDTKEMGSGPVLVFGATSWRSFLGAVKDDFGCPS